MTATHLPPGAEIVGEYKITRTLSHGRQLEVGYITIYLLNGRTHYRTKADPPTADNFERLQQIVYRRIEHDGFHQSRFAGTENQTG